MTLSVQGVGIVVRQISHESVRLAYGVRFSANHNKKWKMAGVIGYAQNQGVTLCSAVIVN
jgi:hypothetical protein